MEGKLVCVSPLYALAPQKPLLSREYFSWLSGLSSAISCDYQAILHLRYILETI